MRECRLAARLSQDELGRAIGLERSVIAKAEAGTRRVEALEPARLPTALRTCWRRSCSPGCTTCGSWFAAHELELDDFARAERLDVLADLPLDHDCLTHRGRPDRFRDA